MQLPVIGIQNVAVVGIEYMGKELCLKCTLAWFLIGVIDEFFSSKFPSFSYVVAYLISLTTTGESKAAYTLANILFANGPCNVVTSWEFEKLQTNIVPTEL